MTKTRYLTALPVGGVLLAGVLLAGCGARSGDTERVASLGAGSTTPPAAVDRARQIELYRDCLAARHVKLLDHPTEEGLPQVDKEHTPLDVLSAALDGCRRLQPGGADIVKRSPVDLEALRAYSVCLRAHGVPDYPDPDPVTGDPRISDELSARLKSDPNMATATQQCQDPRTAAGTGAVVG